LQASLRRGLGQLRGESSWALPALGAIAAIAGLCVQGATDTIFFRPEVQLIGWFCLATLAVSEPRSASRQPAAANGQQPIASGQPAASTATIPSGPQPANDLQAANTATIPGRPGASRPKPDNDQPGAIGPKPNAILPDPWA
jgi:hypothetical protein